MRIISWNVNGIRSVISKGALQTLIAECVPDILCLQETKAKQGQAILELAGYEEIWNSAERAGYSGTAVFSRIEPLSVARNFDDAILSKYDFADEFGDVSTEGRLLTIEYNDFYLINTYVPNAKDDLGRLGMRERVWDKALLEYIKALERKKPVLICGDFNVAHQEIDLARPKQNVGHAGFTNEERKGMDNYLAAGLIDTFRVLHPDEVKYSWWSYRGGARQRNVGWRIDYFLATQGISARVKGADILNSVMGSDHCPIEVEVDAL